MRFNLRSDSQVAAERRQNASQAEADEQAGNHQPSSCMAKETHHSNYIIRGAA